MDVSSIRSSFVDRPGVFFQSSEHQLLTIWRRTRHWLIFREFIQSMRIGPISVGDEQPRVPKIEQPSIRKQASTKHTFIPEAASLSRGQRDKPHGEFGLDEASAGHKQSRTIFCETENLRIENIRGNF